MRQLLARLACVSAFVAFAVPAFAQRTTGSIVGTVTDESGAVLPGVTVTLKGEAVVGTQTSVSTERGLYRFPALPPGSYTLTFALSGFATLNHPNVRVSVGGTHEENAALKLSQLSEEVTVADEAPVVDTTSNQVSTNYDKEWVRNAPVPRFTFFDLINAAPGVNQAQAGDSRSTSLGAATSESSYQLDGTDFTAPLTGAAWPWPNTDAIEEIEVLSVGAPAEYGNVQGAVFNVVTRQGSNAFHGDANFYYQSDGLTGRNTTDEEDGGVPFHREKFNDMTLQFSGPMIKDKLWFFASYQYQRDFKSPVGQDPDFPNKDQADRVFGKLNWQINSKHKLMLAYHDDYYRIPCIDNACNALTDPTTIKVEHGHNPSPNLTYTGVLSEKTYIEARVSGFYGKDHADPLLDSEPRIKPRYLNLDTGEITGGIYSWYDGDIWKTRVSAKVSHFTDHFLGGSHDFKFGVEATDGGADYLGGYNDYIRTYGDGSVAYAYGYLMPGHLAGSTRGLGAFVDDSFKVNQRLTLNVGVRYDYNKAFFDSYPILDRNGNETGQTTQAVSKLYAWNSISPRIGFNYKLNKDGRTVIKAHYGRYYRGVITGEFDDVGPSKPPLVFFMGYDEAGNRIDEEVVADNSQLRVDSGFKNPYTDQYVIGFEHELARNFGVSAMYIYKRGEHYGGWRDVGGTYTPIVYDDPVTGNSFDLFRRDSDASESQFLLTNPGELSSRYHGVTLQLNKRFSNHWLAIGSFVWSKAEGRIGSSNLGPTDEPNSTARRFGQNPNDYVNTDGRLIYDRPITAKVQLVYEFSHGFLVGLNYTLQKGRPYAPVLQVSDEVVGLPTQILTEPIDGSFRVGTWNTVDLRLQKEFALSDQTRIAILADALNLFNNAAWDGTDRLIESENFGLKTDFILPRRIMLGAKFKF